MTENTAHAPLTKWQRLAIGFLIWVVLLFGCFVLLRGAFLQRRMCDLGCFLRAAWAVRTGGDIYGVTDDNKWHYNYPPLFAIVMTPLADPPFGAAREGYIPYAWTVAICYLLNLACLAWGVHALASALEERLSDLREHPRFCQRWWALRLLPVIVCISPIGHTLMRGQVNILLLTLCCLAMASWLRGFNFRAGVWLALAICLKVIPIYLLVYPLWKRDWRGLSGCGVGLLAGLVLIPLAVFGPETTVTHYRSYGRVFLGPLFNMSDDTSRHGEIIGVNSSDSVGVRSAIHNWMYPNMHTRPEQMHPAGKAAYLILGFGMTFLTLWPGTWPRRETEILPAHQIGGLILLMTIFSPVTHSHYLLLCLPIVMSLLAHGWQFQTTIQIPRMLIVAFTLFVATMGIAYLPGMEVLKQRCASLFATLPLWAIPLMQTWRVKKKQEREIELPLAA